MTEQLNGALANVLYSHALALLIHPCMCRRVWSVGLAAISPSPTKLRDHTDDSNILNEWRMNENEREVPPSSCACAVFIPEKQSRRWINICEKPFFSININALGM